MILDAIALIWPFIFPIIWMVGLILGFGLLLWAAHVDAGSTPRSTLGSHLYMSGVTFFTVGYGDLVPQARLGRLISVLEAGTGLGFIALVIGYLPVLYQLFSRREAHVIKLDGRAGSPPTALGLLRPLHRVHPEIRQAVSPPGRRDPGGSARYAEEVRQGRFPAAEHTYSR